MAGKPLHITKSHRIYQAESPWICWNHRTRIAEGPDEVSTHSIDIVQKPTSEFAEPNHIATVKADFKNHQKLFANLRLVLSAPILYNELFRIYSLMDEGKLPKRRFTRIGKILKQIKR